MDDVKAIKNSVMSQMSLLTDMAGHEYSFIVESKNLGDRVEVRFGEFDDIDLCQLLSLAKKIKLKSEYFINSVELSVKHRQVKIEVKKGIEDSEIDFDPRHLECTSRNFDLESHDLKRYMTFFSPSEKMEGYNVFNMAHKLLPEGSITVVKNVPGPESYNVKMFLVEDVVVDSRFVSYFGSRYQRCLLIGDLHSPRLVFFIEKKAKDIV